MWRDRALDHVAALDLGKTQSQSKQPSRRTFSSSISKRFPYAVRVKHVSDDFLRSEGNHCAFAGEFTVALLAIATRQPRFTTPIHTHYCPVDGIKFSLKVRYFHVTVHPL